MTIYLEEFYNLDSIHKMEYLLYIMMEYIELFKKYNVTDKTLLYNLYIYETTIKKLSTNLIMAKDLKFISNKTRNYIPTFLVKSNIKILRDVISLGAGDALFVINRISTKVSLMNLSHAIDAMLLKYELENRSLEVETLKDFRLYQKEINR